MCTKPLTFNFDTKIFTSVIEITLDPLCNGITVFNGGTSTIMFQGDFILPQVSKTIGGNFAEILRGRVDISFTGMGNNYAVITQKFYLPGQWLDHQEIKP